MFANLELFLQEKDVYKQKVEEIRSSSQSPEELEKRLAEAEEGFKSQVRKYLSSAINVINTNFQCQYSIYKVGKDFDVNFQVVETNVRKTRQEVIAEMEEFKKQAMSMTLTNEQIMKINIAMEVLLTYSEDAETKVDENKEAFLSEAKVTATSIVETPSRENNAFEPAPTEEPNFNPYANQPIELDDGFKNPTYEKKTFIDPFAGIYGAGNVSPNEIPEATPDFGVPTPIMPPNNAPQTPPPGGEAMAIFGAGVISSPSTPPDNTVPFSNPMNAYDNNSFNTNQGASPMMNQMPDLLAPQSSMNQPNNFNNASMNALPNSNMESASSNSYSYALNSENMETRVQTMTNQEPDKLTLVEDDGKPKEKAFIISKIIKGLLRLPITTLLFLGIIVLIFWGLDKANLMEEITEILGDYMKYAELILVLIIMLVGSSSVLDAMATKTKYISKHAMTSLAIFAGSLYGIKLLIPIVMDNFLADKLSLEVNLQVFVYCAYFIVLAYFMGTFTWLFAFLRTDKKVLKKKHLNLFEILCALWCVYVFVIPAVMAGCTWCGLEIVQEKVNFIYDYAHCDLIIVIASFSLGIITALFSKLAEKKL